MHRTAFEWKVPGDHPALAGHFPDRPIVPGVVLLDRTLLCAASLLPFVATGWQVASCKFFRPVGPDEILVFELRKHGENAFAFSIRCGEDEVATGSLQATR